MGGTYTAVSYIAGYMLIKTPDGNTRIMYIGSSYKDGWSGAIGYVTRAIPVNVSAGTKLALCGYGAANSNTRGTYISLYTVYL